MPNYNARNWTSNQWYNFLCGIIGRDKLVPKKEEEPEDPEIDKLIIKDSIKLTFIQNAVNTRTLAEQVSINDFCVFTLIKPPMEYAEEITDSLVITDICVETLVKGPAVYSDSQAEGLVISDIVSYVKEVGPTEYFSENEDSLVISDFASFSKETI